MKKAIEAIHGSQPICYSLEELYLAVENSCSHGLAAELYTNLKTQCQEHMTCHLPGFNQLVIIFLLPFLLHSLLPSSSSTCPLFFLSLSLPHRDNVDEGSYMIIVDRLWGSFCRQMVTQRYMYM